MHAGAENNINDSGDDFELNTGIFLLAKAIRNHRCYDQAIIPCLTFGSKVYTPPPRWI
jgi:hypothetical protein